MEYLYATLLLQESGEELNETNLMGVLESAGVDSVESRVKALVAALEEVDVEAAGRSIREALDADPPVDGGPPSSSVATDGRPSAADGDDQSVDAALDDSSPVGGGDDESPAGH